MAMAGNNGGGPSRENNGGNGNRRIGRPILGIEEASSESSNDHNLFDWIDNQERIELLNAVAMREYMRSPELELERGLNDEALGGHFGVGGMRPPGQYGAYYNFSRFVRYYNAQARFNAVNPRQNQGIAAFNYGIGHGYIGHLAGRAAAEPQREAPGGQGGGLGGSRPADEMHLVVINNMRIICFTSKLQYAYRHRDGQTLSDYLCLRHNHVFDIMKATNYGITIRALCEDQNLAEAIIAHIDCVKALLMRNLQLALFNQRVALHFIRKLLNDRFIRGEQWTVPVISTMYYDLQIIMNRAAAAMNAPVTSGGRVYFRMIWAIGEATCYRQNGCRCNIHQTLQRRRFFRE